MATNKPSASRSDRKKQVLTERDILQAWHEKKQQLVVPARMLITPAARAAKVRIELRREGEPEKAAPRAIFSRAAICRCHRYRR
jgi:hypothetical protein